MANCDKNKDRRGSDSNSWRSGQCQCTVCGENVNDIDFSKNSSENRNGSSRLSHPTCRSRTNNEEFKPITFTCVPKPNPAYGREEWSSSENSFDCKRPSKSNTQDNWNKCVHFCDVEMGKPSLKRDSNDKKHCDCVDCQGADHLCDCQLCQTEKSSSKLGEARNLMHARSMFEQIPSPDAYIQRHSERVSCDNDQFTNFSPPTCSTQKCCPVFQEKPSTSAACRSFCKGNVGAVRLDTLRSIAKTELNNSIFHGASDMSSCTDFGNEDEKRGAKEKESLLIEDTYNPGIIEDSVSGVKDFNAISFGMFFEDGQEIPEALPNQTPMTLIEAFHKRIAIERDHMVDALNCHELNLLTVEAIDLYFSYKPKTELNFALSSLFKAEALYKKEHKASKQNTQKVDLPYDVKITKEEMPLVGGSPITVEVYTGVTSPHSLMSKTDSKSKGKGKSKKSEFKVELK